MLYILLFFIFVFSYNLTRVWQPILQKHTHTFQCNTKVCTFIVKHTVGFVFKIGKVFSINIWIIQIANMKKILEFDEFINENNRSWVAVQVTTRDHFGKTVTSQRVVTYETYKNLTMSDYTKGGMEILSVTKLSEPMPNRESAEYLLNKPDRKVRKTEINKGDSDYLVSVISMGTLSSGGKTKFGWSIWEEGEKTKKLGGETFIYVLNNGILLWGRKDSLKIEDRVTLIDNDTRKKIQLGTGTVKYVWNASSKEDFINDVRNSNSRYVKPRKYSFGKVTDGVDWNAFRTIYSIKGIE